MRRTAFAIFSAGMWIGACEFLRNELLFKDYWVETFAELGLAFPSEPVNNAMWAVWSLLLAGCLAFLSGRLRFAGMVGVVWVLAFPMMWLVAANLGFLPLALLPVAVPWSLVEVAGAALIVRGVMPEASGGR